jgi:Rrf2 family protein
MKLSTRSRYGLRALVAVARAKDPWITGEHLAADEEISKKYLDEILRTLRQSGFLESHRGRQGGYSLARRADAINLLEIIDALEGSTDLVHCVDDADSCERSPECPTRRVWVTATERMRDVFRDMTLASFLECPDEECKGPVLLNVDPPSSSRAV